MKKANKIKWERYDSDHYYGEGNLFRIFRSREAQKVGGFNLVIDDPALNDLKLKEAKAIADCLVANFPEIFKAAK